MSETPAIEAEGLVKHYGKTKALDGLDLTVAQGKPSTACSDRTARARPPRCACSPRCCARTAAGPGSLGHDVVAEAAVVRRTIGLTGQYAALDEYLTGRSNLVMIGRLSRLTARAATAARRRAAGAVRPGGGRDEGGQDLLGRHAAASRPGGEPDRRTRACCSLTSRPPASTRPPARSMWDIVRELVADGTTLLLTTQYLDEADQLADRIAVIDGGRVIAEGTPAELKASVGGQRLLITLAEASRRRGRGQGAAAVRHRLHHPERPCFRPRGPAPGGSRHRHGRASHRGAARARRRRRRGERHRGAQRIARRRVPARSPATRRRRRTKTKTRQTRPN